jgi:hypothetical protein
MPKRSTAAAAIVTAAFVTLLLSALRDTSAQGNTPLTAMDYIEIQQLVNKLNFALDYCTNGGQDFADLFVGGGEFTIDNGDGNPRTMSTRQQLIALTGGPDCAARKTPPTSYILHLAESLVIEPSQEGARGKSYAIYPSKTGKYFREDVAGQLGVYHDEYIKTPDGWRFKLRRHETSPVVGASDL